MTSSDGLVRAVGVFREVDRIRDRRFQGVQDVEGLRSGGSRSLVFDPASDLATANRYSFLSECLSLSGAVGFGHR